MISKQYSVNEDGDATAVARVTNNDDDLVTIATVSSIALSVTPLTVHGRQDTAKTQYTATPAASDVFYDTEQTDAGLWPNPPHNDGGFNFKHVIPAEAFAYGDVHFQVLYKITLTDGSVVHVRYDRVYARPSF